MCVLGEGNGHPNRNLSLQMCLIHQEGKQFTYLMEGDPVSVCALPFWELSMHMDGNRQKNLIHLIDKELIVAILHKHKQEWGRWKVSSMKEGLPAPCFFVWKG